MCFFLIELEPTKADVPDTELSKVAASSQKCSVVVKMIESLIKSFQFFFFVLFFGVIPISEQLCTCKLEAHLMKQNRGYFCFSFSKVRNIETCGEHRFSTRTRHSMDPRLDILVK